MATVVGGFAFLYPVVMATIWMVGRLYYYLHRERGQACRGSAADAALPAGVRAGALPQRGQERRPGSGSSGCAGRRAFSILIDRRYERDIAQSYFWMIWYPIFFWVIGWLTVLVAAPPVLMGRAEGRAVWVSPDRGVA